MAARWSMRLLLLLLPLAITGPTFAPVCVGFDAPADGEVSARFAPEGRFEGHWGIDFDVEPGAEVRAAGAGAVHFEGQVVGVRSVTIDHGDGVLSTVSWLDATNVRRGQAVSSGDLLGTFNGGHEGGLHFSVRIDGAYVDPEPLLGCVGDGYAEALRLVP